MQPVEQLFAVGSDNVDLRIVDVTIYESRYDQFAGEILDARIAGQCPQEHVSLAEFGNQTVLHDK